MPIPTQVQPSRTVFQVKGDLMLPSKLTTAANHVMHEACRMFVNQVMLAPGVPCAVEFETGAGSVVGPGRLVGPDLAATNLVHAADQAKKPLDLGSADEARFTEVVTRIAAAALNGFREVAQSVPGAPIAGRATAVPISFTAPLPVVRQELEQIARSLNPPRVAAPPTQRPTSPWQSARPTESRLPPGDAPLMGGHRAGAMHHPAQKMKNLLPRDFANDTAVLAMAWLEEMERSVMVAPGVPVAGQVTAAPGRLI